MENGTSSEEVEIKHSFVSYMQGDPYITEQHKIYATIKPSEIGQTQSSVPKFTSTISHNVTESNHSINAQKTDFRPNQNQKNIYSQNGPQNNSYRQVSSPQNTFSSQQL